VRLFVAVWPPAAVLDEVVRIDRPPVAGLRWTAPDSWHVTLRFLGEVPAADPVLVALDQAALPAVTARLGETVVRLGRGVLCVDVAGLESLALAVTGATAGIGRPPERRPFHGHLTLARAAGHRSAAVPAGAAGACLAPLTWAVRSVQVVRSHLGRPAARYEVLAEFGCV
jgi:2'-5' RNA ligase